MICKLSSEHHVRITRYMTMYNWPGAVVFNVVQPWQTVERFRQIVCRRNTRNDLTLFVHNSLSNKRNTRRVQLKFSFCAYQSRYRTHRIMHTIRRSFCLKAFFFQRFAPQCIIVGYFSRILNTVVDRMKTPAYSFGEKSIKRNLKTTTTIIT